MTWKYPRSLGRVACGSMVQKHEQQNQRKRASTSHCSAPGVRRRPARKTAGIAASSNATPAMRAILPIGSPRSREYSQGIANAKTSNRVHTTRRTALKPLRVDHTGVNAHAGRRLNGRFDGPVKQVLRRRVGHKKNVVIPDE